MPHHPRDLGETELDTRAELIESWAEAINSPVGIGASVLGGLAILGYQDGQVGFRMGKGVGRFVEGLLCSISGINVGIGPFKTNFIQCRGERGPGTGPQAGPFAVPAVVGGAGSTPAAPDREGSGGDGAGQTGVPPTGPGPSDRGGSGGGGAGDGPPGGTLPLAPIVERTNGQRSTNGLNREPLPQTNDPIVHPVLQVSGGQVIYKDAAGVTRRTFAGSPNRIGAPKPGAFLVVFPGSNVEAYVPDRAFADRIASEFALARYGSIPARNAALIRSLEWARYWLRALANAPQLREQLGVSAGEIREQSPRPLTPIGDREPVPGLEVRDPTTGRIVRVPPFPIPPLPGLNRLRIPGLPAPSGGGVPIGATS